MYEQKVTIGKKEIKVTTYEKSNLYATGGNRRIEKGQEGEYTKQNNRQRQSIRKKKVRELMLNNFDNGSAKFITLTFGEEEVGKDLEKCKQEFQKFVKRLTYRYGKFKYVATVEVQEERNTFHYHVVCDLPRMEQKDLLKIWGLGSVWIEQVYDIGGLSNYMTKDFTEEKSKALQEKKGYSYSKGLERNKVVRSWKEGEQEEFQEVHKELEGVKPDFVYVTEQEDAGKFFHAVYRGENELYEKIGKIKELEN